MSSCLIGKVFGCLTVLSESHRDPLSGQSHYTCICDCKNTVSISIAKLLNSNHKCNCLDVNIEKVSLISDNNNNNTIENRNTLEFEGWKDIINKCTNPSDIYYKLFGGRGIKVCDRWLNSFESFLEDMGPIPGARYVVGRTNSLSNYEPNSCKWSTRRCSKVPSYKSELYEYDGKSLTLSEILTLTKTRLNGKSECNLRRRVKVNKLSVEEALSIPLKPFKGLRHNFGRNALTFTYNGISKTMREWSKDIGCNYGSLYYRFKKFGDDISKAIQSFTSEKNNTLNM